MNSELVEKALEVVTDEPLLIILFLREFNN